MCGRFSLILFPGELFHEEHVKLIFEETWQQRYNIAPSQDIVVVERLPSGLVASSMAWGIPLKALFPSLPSKLLINAKVETVPKNKVYRELLGSRRLVVPADSFYEWSVENKHKVPYRIGRADGKPLFIGGFSALVEGKPAAAMMTVPARRPVTEIHERMPLLLSEQGAMRWLDIDGALPPLSGETLPLELCRVDSWVNASAHEGPRCHHKIGQTEQ